MPEYRCTVRYSEDLLREAIRAFMWCRIGRSPKLGLAFAIAIGGTAYFAWSGAAPWLLGLFAASLIFIALLIVIVWRAHVLNTIGRFRKMKVKEAVFTFADDSITMASDLGSATMAWSTIEEVWELPRCWMFFNCPSQFFTLPIDGVPQAALSFARGKVAG